MNHFEDVRLTVDDFHRTLIAGNMLLRKHDLALVVKKVENENPLLSRVVLFEKAYELAAIVVKEVRDYRKMQAYYSGTWNREEKRKQPWVPPCLRYIIS